MTASGRIREHLRSSVVGYLALFVALGGSAWALHANSVTSRHIKDNAIKSEDIKDGKGVGGVDVIDASLGGADVASNSLTGGDIATDAIGAGELAGNSVDTAEVVNDSLDGNDVDEFGLSVDAMGCKPGLVLGVARIKGDPDMPSTPSPSSAWIDKDRTCRALSGYQVTVERVGTGIYVADFWPPGFPIPLSLAVASADYTGGGACEDNFISTTLLSEGRVGLQSFDNDGDHQDCWLTVVVL